MTALPGQGGITAAWQMRVATGDGLGSAIARLTGAGEPGKLGEAALDGAAPPYAIPAVRVEGVRVPANAGYMRGSPQREFCFFTESFVDELAHAAGVEPLAFGMSMLGGSPRLARCLQARRSSPNGTGAAREQHGDRGMLGLWLAHRAGRERDHWRRPKDQGPPPRRRG